jgi:cytochrome b
MAELSRSGLRDRAGMARVSLWLGVAGLLSMMPLAAAVLLALGWGFWWESDAPLYAAWFSPPLAISALINGVLARRQGRPARAGIVLGAAALLLCAFCYLTYMFLVAMGALAAAMH